MTKEASENPTALLEDGGLFEQGALAAWCELMVLAANADGELGDDERAALARNVETLTEKKLAEGKLDAFIGEAEARIKASTRGERLAQISVALGDTKKREIAFELTVRVVAADGVLRTSERELLLECADALGIGGDRAADLVKRFAGSSSENRGA